MTEKRFCPNCRSTNVMVGAFVLSCNSCGWHYLNKHPCTVCGKPSVSSFGSNDGKGKSVRLYGCGEHPVSKQLGLKLDGLTAPVPTVTRSGGIESVPLEFSDEIINTPVIYGETVPFLIRPEPEERKT